MPQDAAKIKLPSISEWLHEEPPLARIDDPIVGPYRQPRYTIASSHPYSQSPSSQRPPQLLNERPSRHISHIRHRSSPTLSNDRFSFSSSAVPPHHSPPRPAATSTAPQPSKLLSPLPNHRRDPIQHESPLVRPRTDPREPSSFSRTQRQTRLPTLDSLHDQSRDASVDHNAMQVDQPQARPNSQRQGYSFDVLRPDPSSGCLEHFISSDTYPRGSNTGHRGFSMINDSSMVNGLTPIFQVNMSTSSKGSMRSQESDSLRRDSPDALAGRRQRSPTSSLTSDTAPSSSMDSVLPPSMISFTSRIPSDGSSYVLNHASGDRGQLRDMDSDDGRVSSGDTSKKHVCPQCGRRFNRPSSLKIHINTHTGETPFRCPWPDCGREFNVNSNMRRHLRNHNSSGSSRSGGDRVGSKRRRRCGMSNPSQVVEYSTIVSTSQSFLHSSQSIHPSRNRETPGSSDTLVNLTRERRGTIIDSLAPPISTLSLREGSLTSLGTSDGEDSCDIDISSHGDVDEEDELSDDDDDGDDDEKHYSASVARDIKRPVPSPASSPSLSTCSSFSPSCYSRTSASLSPPPIHHTSCYPGPASKLRPVLVTDSIRIKGQEDE